MDAAVSATYIAFNRIYADHRAKLITREAAIARIRAVSDGLTELGAADLLDHEQAPGARYAAPFVEGVAR